MTQWIMSRVWMYPLVFFDNDLKTHGVKAS